MGWVGLPVPGINLTKFIPAQGLLSPVDKRFSECAWFSECASVVHVGILCKIVVAEIMYTQEFEI